MAKDAGPVYVTVCCINIALFHSKWHGALEMDPA